MSLRLFYFYYVLYHVKKVGRKPTKSFTCSSLPQVQLTQKRLMVYRNKSWAYIINYFGWFAKILSSVKLRQNCGPHRVTPQQGDDGNSVFSYQTSRPINLYQKQASIIIFFYQSGQCCVFLKQSQHLAYFEELIIIMEGADTRLLLLEDLRLQFRTVVDSKRAFDGLNHQLLYINYCIISACTRHDSNRSNK